MRAVWSGFALGVFWLQQQAVLPEAGDWWVLVLTGGAGAGVAVWGLRGWSASGSAPARRHRLTARARRGAGWLALCCAAACIGFGYAALRAQARLAVNLPPGWEGRDIEVTGSIKGLPSRDANGARFLFAVDSNDARLAAFPPVIRLSWIAGDAPPPALEPGERWRLPVRLKRPHGNANFGVRDAEASLLARNVRATGYVSAPQRARRLAGREQGVAVLIDRWRAALRARIDSVLADAPQRGIVIALAIGAQDDISDADWQLLRATGTSHLVAISGLHIGIVAGLTGWLAAALWRRSGWLGRNWPLRLPAQLVGVTAGALFAVLHAALAGFNVPAQRALWMAMLAALAFVGGRQLARSTVFAWALGLVLLVDPWAVVSAGFWLSFCAVGAILYALSGRPRMAVTEQAEAASDQPRRERDDDRQRQGGRRGEQHKAAPPRCLALRGAALRHLRTLCERLRSAAYVQFAVTIALAPLTVYWFSQIPLVGPLANAFAIPWVSVLVTPAVLLGVALPAPLDGFTWHAAHALLEWLMAGLQLLTGPRWAVWWLPQPSAWALAAAALGVLWCLAPRGWPLRWAAPLTWLPLLLPGADGAPAVPSGGFRVTALDVGQGTAVLVQTAHHALLFDAGPGPESSHAGERVVVPFLRAHGVTTLDTLIVSHSDSDHSGGVPAVFDAIDVRQMVAALAVDHPLWSVARQHGAQTAPCAAGQRWQWDGVEFAMLWPDPGPLSGKPNEHCCVLSVRTSAAAASGPPTPQSLKPPRPGNEPARFAALLSADLEASAERVLLARDPAALRAQLLIVPHHGSRTSSTEPFLDSIDPSIAVFQVGFGNRFHHPHAGVYARYVARGIELARSDQHGAVRVDVDPRGEGPALTLERYRETQRRYWMDR
ncbi:ComEC/Rec2 family competence protein [Paraburkholderia sp. MMS20-SJTR3]|uniref:ComEC/Rec2 family competence protein n=1 Tax=Paraburkholderia sejongensis TaxID=2886946 RepID=A0ABS8JXA7_9BURK|nr:ComEC/Rec2 family competence protein [Paraburkholderia sp. MMS20-SJTR3]MCC8394395.1 ComEC/Rec2 family competence protein [Paraburkholderia sp. MMS20-SJTR3]